MNKPLYDFFENDHRRIDGLLKKATQDIHHIDSEIYEQFRVGLLTHIKMEEKILFPAAIKENGGKPLPEMKQLRLDHGALTTLVVPPPTSSLINVMKSLLRIHDEIEERSGGIYDVCEALTEENTDSILEELSKVTPVPLHPHNEKDYVLEAAKRSVQRAGYDYDKLASGEIEN